MWTTVNNPPPPPPPPSELSPVGNILMEAVTKNWIETNSVYSTKCLQDYVNLRHNLLQHNPHEEHNENFSMLKSEQTKSTDADISNVYIKSNTYINKERLVNQSVKVCSDDITGKFVCFDDLFKASSQKHNLVSDSLNETENCNTTGTQNVDQIDYHYFNSPNMEFGDDEIYALPFGGTIEDNEKTAKSIYLSMKFHEQSSDLNPGRENQETIQEKEDKNIFKFSFNNISAQRFNCFSHFNYEQRDDHNLDISKNTEYVCSSELILETEGTHSNTVTSPSFGTERKHSKKNIVNASEDVKHQQTKYVNAYCKLFSQIEDSVEADHGRQGYIDSKETNFHINSKIREYEQSNKFKFIPKCKKQNFVLNKNIRGSYVELNSNKNINLEEANLLIESGKYNATSETAEEENIVQYHDKNVSLKSENCKENNKRKSSDINKLCDLIDRGNHLQNPYFKQNLSDNEFYTDSENISDFHLAGKPSNRNLQSKQHEQPNKYYEQQNIAKEGTVLKKYSTTKKLSDTNVACKKNALLGNKKQRTIPGMFLKTKMKLSSTNKNVNNEHFCKRKTIVQGGVRKKLKFNAPIRTLPDNQENTESEQFQVMKLNSETLLILVKKLSIQEVEKMAFTLIFSEGYTLLNKPPDNPKPMNSTPLGLVFYIRWANQSYEYFMLNPDLKTWEDCALPKNFINMILTNTYVKICFEAQTVFLFLLKMLDIDHSSAACCWYVLDPIVGCWLLDPDNTPQNFMQTYMILNGKEEMHVPSQYDNISQACYLLPFLCSTLDNLQQALIEVSLWSLFTELEMKIVPILAVMEACSICISRNSLQELSLMFDEHLTQIKKKAYTAAGKKFQINSAAELSQILYNDLQLHVENNITIRQTNFKKFKSTSESMLRLLENSHPLPSIVLEYRQIHKAKSTYIDGLLQYLNESDNLSTTWKQTGTATGRLTSSNPNLQAIPKQPIILTDHCQNEDNGVGKEIQIRALFISRTGYSFLAADFQNIEFRIFASYTRDEDLLKLFRKDGDIFQMFSQQWLGSDKHIDREKTKRIVYSVMYGVGASKLSEYIHVSTDEAEKIMNSFIGAFPSLNILKEKVTDQCKLTRSVRSLSGRHRLFPNISSENQALRSQSERQAINFLIQGSVADICKAAMLNCARKGNEMQLDVKLLLQVHDELIWEVADYQVNLFADIIKCAMEEAGNFWCKQFQLTLPLPVAITVGKNWADMKPLQCNEKK